MQQDVVTGPNHIFIGAFCLKPDKFAGWGNYKSLASLTTSVTTCDLTWDCVFLCCSVLDLKTEKASGLAWRRGGNDVN